MDIIVIRYPDGTLKSSPFHVRFGTLKILKTKEKLVNISVNGQTSELIMRLSSSGDAYFVQELRRKETLELENVPEMKKTTNLVVRKTSAPVSPNRQIKSNPNDVERIGIDNFIKESGDNIGNEDNQNIMIPSIKINSANLKRSSKEDVNPKLYCKNKSDDEEEKKIEETKIRKSQELNNHLNWGAIEKELKNLENRNKESSPTSKLHIMKKTIKRMLD